VETPMNHSYEMGRRDMRSCTLGTPPPITLTSPDGMCLNIGTKLVEIAAAEVNKMMLHLEKASGQPAATRQTEKLNIHEDERDNARVLLSQTEAAVSVTVSKSSPSLANPRTICNPNAPCLTDDNAAGH
jgi:hypothetical protein